MDKRYSDGEGYKQSLPRAKKGGKHIRSKKLVYRRRLMCHQSRLSFWDRISEKVAWICIKKAWCPRCQRTTKWTVVGAFEELTRCNECKWVCGGRGPVLQEFETRRK